MRKRVAIFKAIAILLAASPAARADDVGPTSPSYMLPPVSGVTIGGPGGFAFVDGKLHPVWQSGSPLNICATVQTAQLIAVSVQLLPSGLKATTDAKQGVSQTICAAGQTKVLTTGPGWYRVDKF